MKQLLTITALFLLGFHYAGAQNVGIGTITPTDQLHTTGSVRFQNYSGIGTRLMYIDSAGRLTPPPAGTLFSNNTAVAIPDNGCSTNNSATSSVVVSGQPASVAAGKIAVRLVITHPDISTLGVFLTAPNGKVLTLTYLAGAGSNFTGTVFSGEANSYLSASDPAPHTDQFLPYGSPATYCLLTSNAFSFADIGSSSGGNINPNGTWTLKVFDNTAGNTGTLNSWAITFEGQAAFGTSDVTGVVPYFKNGLLSQTNINYEPNGQVRIGPDNFYNNSTFFVPDVLNNGIPLGVYSNNSSQALISIYSNTNTSNVGTRMAHFIGGMSTVLKPSSDYSFIWDGGPFENFTFTQAGRMGIGQTSPGFPLSFASTLGDKIALYGTTGASYGFGIQANLLQMHTDIAGTDIAFGYGSSAAFTENMRIKGTGNVGIGLNNPQQNLSVKGGINLDQVEANGNNLTSALHFGSSSGEAIASNRAISTAGTNYYGLDFYTGNTNRLAISNTGNIGIGMTAPGFPLNFPSTVGDKISFYGNSGVHDGIGIQANLFQFYSDVAGTDLAFGYGSSGAFTENMRIKGSGNVGIGVNNPQQNLSVKNGMNIDQAGTNGNSSTNVLRFGNSSGESIGSNRAVNTAGTNNNGLDFYTASANRMAITNAGNVGIGTLTPSQKLEVAGNAVVQGDLSVNNGKGMLQNTSGTQLKYVVTPVVISGGTISSGFATSVQVTFSQPFSGTPAVFVGNIVAANSGSLYFYMLVTSIDLVTSTGCYLTLSNTSNYNIIPNNTLNIIAIGPQ